MTVFFFVLLVDLWSDEVGSSLDSLKYRKSSYFKIQITKAQRICKRAHARIMGEKYFIGG